MPGFDGVGQGFVYPYHTAQALIKYGTLQGAGTSVKEHPTQRNKDACGRFEVHHAHRGFLIPWYVGSTLEYFTENPAGAPRVADTLIGAPRYTGTSICPLVRPRTPAELV